MSQLRIFTYLPNPRVSKATIAARFCGIELDIRGAGADELKNWLWDFEARVLSEQDRKAAVQHQRVGRVGFKGGQLFKTDAFLEAHPFGTVPAAFSPDGEIGIFESNSIMRCVARLGQESFQLYGSGPYEASRIDSFLDATLVFARDTQKYLLALRAASISPDVHAQAREALSTYLAGIEHALKPDRTFLVADRPSLADIAFACELALLSLERRYGTLLQENHLSPIFYPVLIEHPLAAGQLKRLIKHPVFAPDMRPYVDAIESVPVRV